MADEQKRTREQKRAHDDMLLRVRRAQAAEEHAQACRRCTAVMEKAFDDYWRDERHALSSRRVREDRDEIADTFVLAHPNECPRVQMAVDALQEVWDRKAPSVVPYGTMQVRSPKIRRNEFNDDIWYFMRYNWRASEPGCLLQ